MIKKKISKVIAIFLILMQVFGIVNVFAEELNDKRNINIYISMQEGVKPPVLGEVESSANVLSDAHFELKNAEGDIVDTIITDKNGMAVFNNVPYGDYVLEEIKAPKGYDLIEPNIFEIHSENWNGNDIYVTFQNPKSAEYVETSIKKEKNIELTTNLDMSEIEVDVYQEEGYIDYSIEGYNGELPEDPIFPTKNDILKHLNIEENSENYTIGLEIWDHSFSGKGIKGHLTIPENYVIRSEAFKGNSITGLTIPEVTTIGKEAFMDNEIEGTIEANKLRSLGVRAFMNNKINKVVMDNLESVPTGAFRNNMIQEVSIEKAYSVGQNAFANNKIEKLNASNLEVVREFGFSGNELDSFHTNKDVVFSKNSFNNNPGSYNYMGYFPVFSTATTEKNKIDKEAKIIINPTDNFVEDKKNELEKENQVYLYRTKQDKDLYGYAVAQDDYDNFYYCVDEYTLFTSGVFQRMPIKNTVYVVQHGNNKESDLPVQKQIVSIDKEPENYEMGYESDLVSKLIYHSNEMINEKGLERENNVTIKLLHAVVSNLEVKDVVLTSSNVLEHIKDTSNYQRIIDIFGKDFVDELFSRIKKDNRNYTPATYLEYVDNELNYDGVELSQAVIKPGEPISEKIDISVIKYWKNDVESDRPEAITVDLLRNDEVIETVEITSESGWKYVFSDLDKTDKEGNEYTYTIQEKEVEGYSISLTGDSDKGFELTNTKDPEPEEPEKPVTPEKPEEPKPEDPKPKDPKQQYLPKTGEKREFITLFSGVLLVLMSFFIIKRNLLRKE